MSTSFSRLVWSNPMSAKSHQAASVHDTSIGSTGLGITVA